MFERLKKRTTAQNRRQKSSVSVPSTRADVVRQRRSMEDSKPALKRTAHLQNAATAAIPVTMRSGAMGTRVMDRTRTQVRRKVALPLGTPGSEIQMPSLPLVKPGWRLLSGFFVIAIIIFLALILLTPEFRVGTPEIAGLQRLSFSDLDSVLQLSERPIFLIDPKGVETEIQALFPEFAAISVTVEFPAKLLITVTERQPVLAWQYGDFTSWIDSEGYIFPARGQGEPSFTIVADTAPPLIPVPVEEVENTDQVSDQNTVDQSADQKRLPVDPSILEAVAILQQKVPNLSAISYNKWDGFGWQDENNWNVYIGFQLDDLDQKLVVYQAIKTMLLEKGIQPTVVSVAHVHAPYYR
jgi:cell division septal protein FtsQ